MRGTERIGWSQPAPDPSTLRQYQYVAYVDGARAALTGSLCDSAAVSGTYECSAPLPPLTLGVHVLELATWISAAGSVLESEKSPALRVQMIGLSTAPIAGINVPLSQDFEAGDGVRLRADVLATGLDALADLAVTRDGRVFVLEESGRIRVISEEGLRAEPALEFRWPDAGGRLCSIALHPEFERNRFVFLAYADQWPNEQPLLRIARYREVQDTLGEAAVVVNAVPLPSQFDCAGIRVRFGPDGKLYVTVPDEEVGTSAQSPSALGGKVLRLNPDGTTPTDNPFASPVFSMGHSRPEGFDWHPESAELWLAERVGNVEALSVIAPRPGGVTPGVVTRGVVVRTFRPALTLDPSVGIAGIAFHPGIGIPEFKDNLFMAALRGRYIQRLQFDGARPGAIVRSERLLEGRFGRIAGIATGSDGSLYFCTANRADATDVPYDDYVVRVVRTPEKTTPRPVN